MYYLTSSLMSFVVMRVKPLYYHRCDIVYLSFPPRCGTWLTASWRPTTLVTVASWTQWQSLLMAPCVHLVEGYETNCFYYCRVLQNDLWSLLTHSELNCTSLCPACRFQQWWKFKMHLFNSDDKEAVSECYLQLKKVIVFVLKMYATNSPLINCSMNSIIFIDLVIQAYFLCLSRTARPCCGTWMRASTSTPWTVVTPSMPSASAPTVTGCVPPLAPVSRFG